jgi:hypothetical protein
MSGKFGETLRELDKQASAPENEALTNAGKIWLAEIDGIKFSCGDPSRGANKSTIVDLSKSPFGDGLLLTGNGTLCAFGKPTEAPKASREDGAGHDEGIIEWKK